MPQITIGSGGGNVEAGAYVATLDRVDGPREITLKDGSVMDILEWRFVLPNGEAVKGTTSTASGPRSKLYGWLMALNSGKAPKINETLELNDYRGRRVVITIAIKDDGWPKITDVGPLPVEEQQRDFAAATGAPVREPVAAAAAATDDLDF